MSKLTVLFRSYQERAFSIQARRTMHNFLFVPILFSFLKRKS
jgi:hypothetical protein